MEAVKAQTAEFSCVICTAFNLGWFRLTRVQQRPRGPETLIARNAFLLRFRTSFLDEFLAYLHVDEKDSCLLQLVPFWGAVCGAPFTIFQFRNRTWFR